MVYQNSPKVELKKNQTFHTRAVCVSLTLHVDGKGDLLWIQFIPADLWSGDALRHRAGQRDTSTHINLPIPLACRQRRRCFRKIEEYILGQDSSHKNRCTWNGFAHKTSTGTWTLFDITIMLCLFDLICFKNICDFFCQTTVLSNRIVPYTPTKNTELQFSYSGVSCLWWIIDHAAVNTSIWHTRVIQDNVCTPGNTYMFASNEQKTYKSVFCSL